MTLTLRGAGTALVTPFTAAGDVDADAFTALVEWQIAQGIDFLVPCGSTGEAQTLRPPERKQVIELAVRTADGRVPVVGGVSGNDTRAVTEEVAEISALGVDAVMVVTPYYNKPTQAGLIAHFHAAAEASQVPLMMYTVPGRTAVHLRPATVLELARHPNIIAVKDATGDLGWAMAVLRDLREHPTRFSVLSGEDGLLLPHLACGGHGIVSVASNVVPDLVAAMVQAGRTGDFIAAREIQLRLLPLIDALFCETNPIPVKAALHLMGRMQNVLRLPLVPASEQTIARLRAAMEDAHATAAAR